MKDIEKALQEEQIYLAEVQNNSVTEDLATRLSKCGYDLLSDYFADKKDYIIKSYDYEYYPDVSIDTIWDDVFGAAGRKQPAVFIHLAKYPFVWIGTFDKLNVEKAKEFGLEIKDMQYGGGNIINVAGDLSGAIVCPKDHEITGNYFLKKFYDYLAEHTDGITQNSNDILQNGKKVMSVAYAEYNDMFLFMFQANFSDKYEMIKEICGINPNKEPGFINGITAEELKEEVLSWLQKI